MISPKVERGRTAREKKGREHNVDHFSMIRERYAFHGPRNFTRVVGVCPSHLHKSPIVQEKSAKK